MNLDLNNYFFWDEIENNFNQHIDFSSAKTVDVVNLLNDKEDQYVALDNYIFKFYGYNEYLLALKKQDSGLSNVSYLKILNNYNQFNNDFSQKLFSYILYCCVSEALNSNLITALNSAKESNGLNLIENYLSKKTQNKLTKLQSKNKLNNYNNFINFLIQIKLNIKNNKSDKGLRNNNIFDNKYIKDFTIEELLKCFKVFFMHDFEHGYAGESWKNIANHALIFAKGEINAEMFTDQMLSLEHNNGNIFDKEYIFKYEQEYIELTWLDNDNKCHYVNMINTQLLLILQSKMSVFSLIKNNKQLNFLEGNIEKINNYINENEKKYFIKNIKPIVVELKRISDFLIKEHEDFLKDIDFSLLTCPNFSLKILLEEFYKDKVTP